MTPDTVVTIGLVLIIFAVAATAVGVALYINNRIATVRDEAAQERQNIREAISAQRLHVAETYMSKAGGAAALDRVVDEVKGLRTDLKEELGKLGDRIERMENHILEGS